MAASNIDDVVIMLDAVINDARAKQSRLGFFAALYRLVTVRIRHGIKEGKFEDTSRMDRMATIFGNRYFDALAAFRDGGDLTRAWEIAFCAADSEDPVILQQLLLGMNAHVNLDLAVSAAEVAPGPALPKLEKDFNAVNDLLTELLDPVQRVIDDFSPLFDLIDRLGGRTDERIIGFSLEEARKDAWIHAQMLAHLGPAQLPMAIDSFDKKVAFLAKVIRDPPPPLSLAIPLVRLQEDDNVAAIIDAIIAVGPPS